MEAAAEKLLREALGDRIRGLRKRQGLTQQVVADRLGFTRTSVANIEAGRQRMLVNTLYDMASSLGVPVTELIPIELPKLPASHVDLVIMKRWVSFAEEGVDMANVGGLEKGEST